MQTQPCEISHIPKVPYSCSIDALVWLSAHDKEEREAIEREQKEKEKQKQEQQEQLRRSRELTMENIFKDVCRVREQDTEKVKKRKETRSRETERIICRRLTCYLAYKFTSNCYKKIGEFLGGFDHSSVIHHCQTVADYLQVKEPKWMLIWNHYIANSTLFTENDFK